MNFCVSIYDAVSISSTIASMVAKMTNE